MTFNPDDTGLPVSSPPSVGNVASATLLPPSEAPFESFRFGSYELLSELSRSGGVSVYRARHLLSGRLVALKTIAPGRQAEPETIQHLQNEANVTARMDHPNVIPIYDVGTVDGRPYFTMALATSGSLREQMKQGLPPPWLAARLVQQLAEAVQCAHEHGIVHGDLKPHHVLLFPLARPQADGSRPTPFVARLAGFGQGGAAADANVPADLASGSSIQGAPSYVSPELGSPPLPRLVPTQITAQKEVPDARTDVYGLGGVLYFLLTGQPPFAPAVGTELLRRTLEEKPVPPRTRNRAVPRDLESICLRCLARQPELRYATAQALAEDLGRFLAGMPTQARPLGRLARTGRWCRRHPVKIALLTAVLVALGVGTNRWLKLSDGADQAMALVEKVQRQSVKLTYQADQEKARADELAYTGQLDQALMALQQGDLKLARRCLGSCSKNRIGWEHRYLTALCAANNKADTVFPRKHLDAVTTMAFSLDDHRIVSGCADGTLKIWDADKGVEIVTLRGHRDRINHVAFSPDGKLVASGSDDKTIKLWDVALGVETRTLAGHKTKIMRVLFSPTSKRLVSTGSDSMNKMWDVDKGQETPFDPSELSPAGDRDGNADDSQPPSSGADPWQTIRTSGNAMNTLLNKLKLQAGDCIAPNSSTPQRLATGGTDQTVKIWDVDTGIATLTLKGHAAVTCVLWSRDGNRLVRGSADGTLEVWNAR